MLAYSIKLRNRKTIVEYIQMNMENQYMLLPNSKFKLMLLSTESGPKSKHSTLFPLLDFFNVVIIEAAASGKKERVTNAPLASSSFLCFLMWPPRACPIGNSTPHIGQRCDLVVFVVFLLAMDPEESDDCSSLLLLLTCLLWLARWPPKDWNDENSFIHVLHL